MDEAVAELVSRYLDGDLAETEARALEARLAVEPALRAELAALARVRAAVGELAETEVPPGELDQALSHLWRGAPTSPVRLRPVYRWLAAAATLLLGITVTYRIAQRGPALAPPAKQEAARVLPPAADHAAYSPPQQALPASTSLDERRAATKRGQLETKPRPAPEMSPPPAPPASGPPGGALRDQQLTRPDVPALSETATVAEKEKGRLDRDATAKAQHPSAAMAAAPVVGETACNEASAKTAPEKSLQARTHRADRLGPARAARAALTVHAADGDVVVMLSPRVELARDHYRLIVTVRRGTIAAVHAATGEQPDEVKALVGELMGLPVPSLGDGDYAGEVAAAPSREVDPGAGN